MEFSRGEVALGEVPLGGVPLGGVRFSDTYWKFQVLFWFGFSRFGNQTFGEAEGARLLNLVLCP